MNQHKIKFFSLVGLFLALSSCGNNATTNSETVENTNETTEASTSNNSSTNTQTVYAWVDKLRIRENPSLKGKEIIQVAEGTALSFSGEISKEKIKTKLRGRDIEAPFYKVTTKDGQTGWVFAGALSNSPIDVENYKVAFAFDTRFSDPEEDVSGDFGYYLYEAGQLLVGSGIELIYVEAPFNELEVKNGKQEIIGVENISHLVKKHTTGIVCIEKGKEPKFVDYDPSMGEGVKKAFGLN